MGARRGLGEKAATSSGFSPRLVVTAAAPVRDSPAEWYRRGAGPGFARRAVPRARPGPNQGAPPGASP